MNLPAGPQDPLYRFGPFLADPIVGRLFCGSHEVPLTPKSFSVLLVLLTSNGQLVSKEELFQRIWPDTFVEPNNLARNISMIRKALHEHDADREYIVTISGRGYRFVTPVSEVSRVELAEGAAATVTGRIADPPATVSGLHAEASPSEPVGDLGSAPAVAARAAGGRALVIAAGLAVFLGAAALLVMGLRDRPTDPGPERRLLKLTSGGRLENEPTWSPDGRFVAYSSDRSGNFDIWVQPTGDGNPIQITFGTARDWQPSWSPDGRHIAFRSERDGGGLFVVPALGGDERRLTDFGYQPQWSPDGSRILFSEARDVYVMGLGDPAPTRIADDAWAGLIGRFRVGWHPDGRRIGAYGNDRTHGWSFWTVPIDGGPRIRSAVSPAVAERLRDADVRLGQFVWARDGATLYFEGRSEHTANLWRIRLDPRTLAWVAGPDRLTTSSNLENGLALSPDGKRLAFGSRVERTVAWSLPFDPVSGRIVGDGEAVTPESANAEILDLSPDGSQLAYRVAGRHRHELWIRSLDRQADHLRTVEVDSAIIQPRWSRDGTQLAYLRRPIDPQRAAAVVLLGVNDDGGQRVLPAVHSPEMVYDWSVDGRSFLVRCRTTSVLSAICRLANSEADGSVPDMHIVAADPKRNLYAAKQSPDGRWVSFIAASDLTRSTVFVSPAAGGPWMAMTPPEDRYFEDKPRWSPDGRTLYYLSNRNGFWNLWGRRFDPVAGTPAGDAFQVSRFDSSLQMVPSNVSDLQIAITHRRLILPVTQTSGAVWVLDNVDR
jgi:Tol biopolymer transport system component/DNA-binding winged helix-turn-helix (wHTH) protein